MKKIILTLSLFFIGTVVCHAEGPVPPKGFSFITLQEKGKKSSYYRYWKDYVSPENKNEAIYRQYSMPFFDGSDDTLIFLSVFDLLACGVNNCPYQVVLRQSNGNEKVVLEGIGPNVPEAMFSVKSNGQKPVTINVGNFIFSYDEKAGKYVESRK